MANAMAKRMAKRCGTGVAKVMANRCHTQMLRVKGQNPLWHEPQSGQKPTLRAYQTQAIETLRQRIASGHKRILLTLPTGAGKTVVAAEIIRRGVERQKRSLFLAPRRELVYQTSDKLSDIAVPHGILMSGEFQNRNTPVQIASLDTYHARVCRGKWPRPNAEIVIVDEAHAQFGAKARAVLENYPDAVVIGMTATPARSDGRGLGEVYDTLVEGPSVAELTADGYLVPVRYFAPSQADLQGVKIMAGDYHQGQLSERMSDPTLIGDVIENWQRICPDRRTVVFAVDRAHAMALHSAFHAQGVAVEYIDGNTDNDERKAILRRIRSGESRVICSVDVLSYGWDEPSVSCGIIARPTKSIARYLQAAGRILRPHADKTDAILIDHSGVVADLGFVADDQPWSLAGDERIQDRKTSEERAEPKPMTCPGCKAEFKPAPSCPECGMDLRQQRERLIKSHEAELVEIAAERERKNRPKFANRTETYGMLLGFVRERNMSDGWAAHSYREIYGDWPRRARNTPPLTPSDEVRGWCKSKLIRFAKRRKPSEREKLESLAKIREMVA